MHTDNSRWSRFFVLLSLLSTGLSIVAAGLLFDYSTRILNQSELFSSGTEGVVMATEPKVVNARFARVDASGQLSPARTRAFPPIRLQADAGLTSPSGVDNSILIDALRHKIAKRVDVFHNRASPNLIVLKPAAPELEIKNDILYAVPRAIHIVGGTSRKGRGG